MVLHTQSLALLEAAVKLEHMLSEAIKRRRKYSWHCGIFMQHAASDDDAASDIEAGKGTSQNSKSKLLRRSQVYLACCQNMTWQHVLCHGTVLSCEM